MLRKVHAFLFGTNNANWTTPRVLKSCCHPFLYQELSQTVLVWHATCIETEQNALWLTQNGKAGNWEQGTETKQHLLADHCPLSTDHYPPSTNN